MATKRPEWLKIGTAVNVGIFIGLVMDVAETDFGNVWVWVYGPKNAVHMQRPDILEFDPERIRIATPDEIRAEHKRYIDRRAGIDDVMSANVDAMLKSLPAAPAPKT